MVLHLHPLKGKKKREVSHELHEDKTVAGDDESVDDGWLEVEQTRDTQTFKDFPTYIKMAIVPIKYPGVKLNEDLFALIRVKLVKCFLPREGGLFLQFRRYYLKTDKYYLS